MHLKLIYVQFPLELLVFFAAIYVAFFGLMKRREPQKVLELLVGLNILRFGGGAAALSVMGKTGASAFLTQVAVGDCVTAVLAVIALVLLLRNSSKALSVVLLMNAVGLLDILTSEAWIGHLELRGVVVRNTLIHGPSVGAALYTALHVYIFVFVARARTATRPVPA